MITQEWAETELAKIQPRMALGHWTIEIAVIDDLQYEGDACFGTSDWYSEERQATIKLDSKQTQRTGRGTLKHELCHILLEGHKRKCKAYDTQYEFGLNQLSRLI